MFFGPSYKVNVITGSALGNAAFANKAVNDLLTTQSGILTNSGGDFFGEFCISVASSPTNCRSMGEDPFIHPYNHAKCSPDCARNLPC